MECFVDTTGDCQFVSLGKFLDRSDKVGDVEVYRCKHCGHGISIPPLPDAAFLYEGRESQDYQPGTKGLAHAIKDLAFHSQARKLIRQIGDPPGTILDFGCGSGQFTRVLGELVGTSTVFGADMHPDSPPDLKNTQYLGPSELPAHQGGFDTVLALHVLEHDDDAARLLSTIASYARNGGKVVIEVPNINCTWSKLFGKYWDAWYLPFHRHHFNKESIISLIQRNNLDIESVHNVTVPTMGRSFANIFKKSNNAFWLVCGGIAHPIQLAGEFITHQPSAIRVIAKKNAIQPSSPR